MGKHSRRDDDDTDPSDTIADAIIKMEQAEAEAHKKEEQKDE